MAGQGKLKFQCFIGNTVEPLYRAKIKVTQFDELGNYTISYEDIYTNSNGLTDEILLETPRKSASEDPNLIPYYTYDAEIKKEGFRTVIIQGIQVFPNRVALQQCRLSYDTTGSLGPEVIKIPPHRQVGKYPNKIPETSIKTLDKDGNYSILSKVMIPEYIVVHAGDPDDNSAQNYNVKFSEYIKNCACCELYPTWTDSTLRANIYCMLSFALNRIYTEWYIAKGKNFNITNSTAYDQPYSHGRTLSVNISSIVEELFDNYLQMDNQVQPFLAQYCNGTTVKCPNWLSQWESQYLGEQGYTPYEILTHYYGPSIKIKSALKVSGNPTSYPGKPLDIGSRGMDVSKKQDQLNVISNSYPTIPNVAINGDYDINTKKAVKAYQEAFHLPVTGVIDKATWYSMSNTYTEVMKLGQKVLPRTRNDGGSNREFIFYPPVMNKDDYRNIPRVKYKE